ncbi:hypothetical protein E2C01_023180 [Portunus trituberculatus]|uniref:Uncharacterized protein n=1 Tax=Portunus trituberculatus TaxID=210409 RepID=A0A5B7E999_PORTR|nr:hypothetical protein [Portunus trituberculatus]
MKSSVVSGQPSGIRDGYWEGDYKGMKKVDRSDLLVTSGPETFLVCGGGGGGRSRHRTPCTTLLASRRLVACKMHATKLPLPDEAPLVAEIVWVFMLFLSGIVAPRVAEGYWNVEFRDLVLDFCQPSEWRANLSANEFRLTAGKSCSDTEMKASHLWMYGRHVPRKIIFLASRTRSPLHFIPANTVSGG